jgi:hypothetical protein
MKRIFRRAVVAASSLGMVGGIALTALPASAAPTIPVVSFGAAATGPVHFGPVAFASTFHTPGVASNANYTNFLTTGMIVDRASFTTGYSLVNSPLVQINFLQLRIQASQITSWCHRFRSFAIGGASIFSGSVVQSGRYGSSYNPLTNPGPNTTVYFYGGYVTFNKQTYVGGRLTVTAIYVHAGPENLYLGVSSCAVHRDVS